MTTQIIPFRSGINTCYIIRERGTIMIDGAWSGSGPSFRRFLERHKISPSEIKLIVLTHGDFDHVGGTRELKEITGAIVAIHENDRRLLEEGIFHWPGGVTSWGRISRAIFKPVIRMIASFPSAKADLILDEHDHSLEEYGICGRIVFTPGHTFGSVSVLLNSGDAFVGCLLHNSIPFTLRPRLPIYSKDIGLLKESLKKVLEQGATTLYPGHGKPVPVKRIKAFLD
jgi:glyoxylase-like metal-dependent hydrolase (beta-lactamase superfamily II)